MEGIRSRAASIGLKKRPSLSLLFHPQKPTFTLFDDGPTRYYEFADSPVNYQPNTPLIDRQKISSDLESEIRFSCSLLVYRVERGMPSPPEQTAPETKSEANDKEAPVARPQIESKYQTPLVGRDAAALKDDRIDSGVGLTAQPSRQTMRILQSAHSDRPSEAETARPASLFSHKRCTTAGSTTTYQDNASQHSSQHAQHHDITQSGTGTAIMSHPQAYDQKDTRAFLSSNDARPASPSIYDEDQAEDDDDDVEVFLNPDAGFAASTTVPSFSSGPTSMRTNPNARFGVADVSTPQPTTYQAPEYITEQSFLASEDPNQPSVIIDNNGFLHIMTAAEENERDSDLRQAVMAKMGGANTAPPPTAIRPPTAIPPPTAVRPPTAIPPSEAIQTIELIAPPQPARCADTHQRPQTAMSRLKSSWSSRTKGSLSKFGGVPVEVQVTQTTTQSAKKRTWFQQIAGLFGSCTRQRSTEDGI